MQKSLLYKWEENLQVLLNEEKTLGTQGKKSWSRGKAKQRQCSPTRFLVCLLSEFLVLNHIKTLSIQKITCKKSM